MNGYIYAYCAAFIDGEGSICLNKEHANSKFRVPSIYVSSTTLPILQDLQKYFGGYIVEEKTRYVHYKKAWKWQVKRKDAIVCMEKIIKYMREPAKVRRAQLILANKKYYNKMGHRNEKDLLAMRNIEKVFFK